MRTVFKSAAVDENLREIMQSAMSAAITVIALSDSDCRNLRILLMALHSHKT